jgi:glycosyltransferase involved in cell wall biosynthesis
LPALKVIISLDDLLSEIPEDSSVYKHFQANIRDVRTRLKLAFKLADRIVVSTQFIKDYYHGAHPDIRVVPNRLSRAIWGELSSTRGQGSKPRVGWVGAQQHKGDLRILAEVIRRTADRVDWVFMGMWPEGVDELIAEKHNPVSYSEYPAKLASLNLDLALAPLEDNAFNAGKSNLRLLEYGVLGWPVVCSDVYPYRTANPPVTRVAWQVDAWVAAIDEHLQKPDWSAQQGRALRSWVDHHFWLEDHIAEWQQALLGR